MDTAPAPPRRYGGKTHDERRAERRSRLLDAGLELFGTRGFTQTTIEMICSHARLNPRYFYQEYASREELLGAVYDRHIQAVTEAVTTAIEQAPLDPLARLHTGLRTFLDKVLADPRGARINYFEMVGVSPQLEDKRRSILRAYADLVARQITEVSRATPIPVRDHRLAAVAMVGATDGLIIDSLSNHKGNNRNKIITTLLELVDAILRHENSDS
jgi:AcrR family transcriptional regulator